MTSAAFTVNGSAVTGAVSVAYGSTVSLALVSVTGVKSIAWLAISRSTTAVALPTITSAGSPSGVTATFTMPADTGNGQGAAFIVRCSVIGNDGLTYTASAVIGVENRNDVVPVVAGETSERDSELGWIGALNAELASVSYATGVIDVTQSPYSMVAGSRSAAAANTLALQAAIDAAIAGNLEVVIPPGTYHLAKGAAAADYNGYTSAVLVGIGATPTYYPLRIRGAGQRKTVLNYCSSGGAYNCIMHRAETVTIDSDPNYGICIEGIGLQCTDATSATSCRFGIKLRHCPALRLNDIASMNASECNVALDWCFDSSATDIAAGYGYNGIMLGAYAGGQNSFVLTNGASNGQTGIGIGVLRSSAVTLKGCAAQYCTGTGLFLAHNQGVDADMYFEGNSSSGLTISSVAHQADVVLFRGDISKSTPTAWTFSWNSVSDGAGGSASTYDQRYNNIGIRLKAYASTALPQFAIGNAYDGIQFDVVRYPYSGTFIPILRYFADSSNGIVMEYRLLPSCRGFLPPVPYSGCVLYGATTMHSALESKTPGIAVRNLIGQDPAGELTLSWLSGLSGGDGSGGLSYVTSGANTYMGSPVLQFTGASIPKPLGKELSVTASPELAGKQLVVAARVYDPNGLASDVVCTAVSGASGGAGGVSYSLGGHASGWRTLGNVFTMPASGAVNVGFTKLGTGTALCTDLAIYELGAGYEDVVASKQQSADPITIDVTSAAYTVTNPGTSLRFRMRGNADTGNCIVTLPTSTAILDKSIYALADVVGNAAASTFRVTAGSGTTINGAASVDITTNYGSIVLIYNQTASKWENL